MRKIKLQLTQTTESNVSRYKKPKNTFTSFLANCTQLDRMGSGQTNARDSPELDILFRNILNLISKFVFIAKITQKNFALLLIVIKISNFF